MGAAGWRGGIGGRRGFGLDRKRGRTRWTGAAAAGSGPRRVPRKSAASAIPSTSTVATAIRMPRLPSATGRYRPG